MSRDSWPYKWGKRFYKNLVPPSGKMGFDGITPGSGASKMERYEERHDDLARRIANNGGIPFSSSSPYCPDLPSHVLSWNTNPHCPPKTWKDMEVEPDKSYTKCSRNYDMWHRNNKKDTLVLMRHMYYELTLKYATYFESYFSCIREDKEADIRSYFFWLIDANEASFVYAILKSSMFKAWCELTAATDVRIKIHIGKGGKKTSKKYQEQGHFTVGMWDTFPLPGLDSPKRAAIKQAGQNLKNRNGTQEDLDKAIDSLFNLSWVPSHKFRLRMLAEGFLDAFYGK